MIQVIFIFLLSFNLLAQRPAGSSPGGVAAIGTMTGMATTATLAPGATPTPPPCAPKDRPIHPVPVPANSPTAVICRKMVKVWNPLTIKETNPKKKKYLFLYKEYYWNYPQSSVNTEYTNNKTYLHEGKYTGGWRRLDSVGDIQQVAKAAPNAPICVTGINNFQTSLNSYTANPDNIPPSPVSSFINQNASNATACRFLYSAGSQAFPFPYWLTNTVFNSIPRTGTGGCTGALGNLRMQATVNGIAGKAVQLVVSGTDTPDPSCTSTRDFSCYDTGGQTATSTQTLTYARINAGMTLSCGTGTYSFSPTSTNCGSLGVGIIVAGFTKTNTSRAPDTIANCPTEVPTCGEAMLVAMKDKKERVSNGDQDFDLQHYHDAGLTAPNAKGLTANIPVLPASASWNCSAP